MYADFDLLVPEKLDQALAMIAGARSARDAAPLGGGTNLVVEMRAKGEGPATLVSIGRLAGLRGITIGDHRVTIGAATTVSDILRHPGMADAAPALVTALAMPLTFSIANGIALGFITYVAIKLVSGRYQQLNAALVAIAVLFVLKFAFLG